MITPPTTITTSAYTPTAASAVQDDDEPDKTGTPPHVLDANAGSDSMEQEKLRELQARDREVRAHEQAHLSAAGSYAKGGATFTYQRGSDQRLYAVGGEVQVDTSKVTNDPVATLRKAQVIRRAALAPVEPSAQDRQVAAEASRMEAEARQEIAAQRTSSESASAASDSVAGDQSDTAIAESGNSTDKVAESCPACGGAHSAGAHDGMVAYAANA